MNTSGANPGPTQSAYVRAWHHRSYVLNQFRIFSNTFMDNPTETTKILLDEYAVALIRANKTVAEATSSTGTSP